MLQKFAEATIIGAEIATRDAFGLVKAAHRAVFDYEPRPGFLYVRSRMISSRCNDNWDEFPAEDIKASWKTAKGKPAFVNHHNETHKRMRGVIIDAALHEDTLPDGKPDVWIEALHEIDAKKFPKLAKSILEGRVNRTSMGCDVGFSVCSACNNKASSPAEYCAHIPKMKGKILYRHAASGEREGHLVREICHKLSFFENSFLVEDPADPTAVVTGIDDRGLKAAASKTAKPWMPEQGQNYHGTHCLVCGENVKYYVKPSQGQHGGLWSHHDGMKRDHLALPADPDKVVNGIPAADAARDQAKAEMRKQLGLPSLRDRDRMPPDPFTTSSRKVTSMRTEAYGETKAPADVDTLRTESCPVCGETDSFDGDRCEVCKFIQPPSMFTDPDTGVAKQMDMRKDQFDQGMVGPNGEPIPGVDEQGTAMEEGAPGMPGDQVADLFCPACGFSADTAPPMTNNDPAMNEAEGQQGLLEGDVCPQCGEATMLSPNEIGEMGGEVPQEIADDADADAIPDDQEPDADGDGLPDDAEALEGAEAPDDNETDLDGDGIPDAAEEPQEGLEEEPEEVDQDPNAVQDEEEPPKGRKDTTRRASRRGHERESMNQPNKAATEASSTIAALQQKIAVQAALLDTFGQQMHYLGKVAGVTREFEALKAQAAKKIADIMNPAQPIPDPPGGAPTETTQEAEQPETYDDPRNPGITPGSLNGVPAQATDTPLTPGATLPTSPYTQLVDPTQPVAGTEQHVDPSQTKIETDVRVGDPMANAGTPQGTAFPLTGPFGQEGAASANTTTSPGYQQGAGGPGRTMASIRLARLRKSAGLIDVNTDELVAAAEIEKTAGLSDEVIAHEITTLSSLASQAARNPARRPQGGPMPKVAHSDRRAPSLVNAPEMAMTAAAGIADDDSDLFS